MLHGQKYWVSITEYGQIWIVTNVAQEGLDHNLYSSSAQKHFDGIEVRAFEFFHVKCTQASFSRLCSVHCGTVMQEQKKAFSKDEFILMNWWWPESQDKKTPQKKQNGGSSVKTLKWELHSSWPAADQKKQTSWRAAFWLLLRCPWARQRHFQSALFVSRFTLSSLFACPRVCVSILRAVCRGEWKWYFIVLYQQ